MATVNLNSQLVLILEILGVVLSESWPIARAMTYQISRMKTMPTISACLTCFWMGSKMYCAMSFRCQIWCHWRLTLSLAVVFDPVLLSDWLRIWHLLVSLTPYLTHLRSFWDNKKTVWVISGSCSPTSKSWPPQPDDDDDDGCVYWEKPNYTIDTVTAPFAVHNYDTCQPSPEMQSNISHSLAMTPGWHCNWQLMVSLTTGLTL